jgi:hypothetical protein
MSVDNRKRYGGDSRTKILMFSTLQEAQVRYIFSAVNYSDIFIMDDAEVFWKIVKNILPHLSLFIL